MELDLRLVQTPFRSIGIECLLSEKQFLALNDREGRKSGVLNLELAAHRECPAPLPKKTSFSPTFFKLGHIFEQIAALGPGKCQIMHLLHI
ncbi:hypothetical protein [Sphingomonas mesophila]|uniref:hypothetical protein n=1 Tax=Sphingomonas mesophila TaxID=2303576 RepID=UPI0013C34386|nr:hypothetical protein [Sphingomonas mesophila]